MPMVRVLREDVHGDGLAEDVHEEVLAVDAHGEGLAPRRAEQ